MKKITVENFGHSILKECLLTYSHEDMVKFAIHCAELAIDLHPGSSDESKKAIQFAKDWLLNPSEENRKKCKAAADAAYIEADGANAAYAASYATYAAFYSAGDYIDPTNAGAAAAYAAGYAVAAEYTADRKSMIEKIIAWFNKPEQSDTPKTQSCIKVEYVKVESIFKLNLDEFMTDKYVFKDGGDYRPVSSESVLIESIKTSSLYRKVERPVEWWEVINDEYGSVGVKVSEDGIFTMTPKSGMIDGVFFTMCKRVNELLEQDGE